MSLMRLTEHRTSILMSLFKYANVLLNHVQKIFEQKIVEFYLPADSDLLSSGDSRILGGLEELMKL